MSEPDTPALRARGGLSPRKRQKISRGIQYAILLAMIGTLALLADWPEIGKAFFNAQVAADGLPDLFTVALKNTVIYTVSGFVLGFALGLVLGCRRSPPTGGSRPPTSRSSAGCPRWSSS
jgi:polar amino acid transport system permease protein